MSGVAPEDRVLGAEGGRLARNVMHFARALRAAGLPVGPGRVLQALQAVETVGVEQRVDLYWTLHAVFVSRRDQRPIFDQAFHVFWRDPKLLERLQALLLPQIEMAGAAEPEALSRRVGEALAQGRQPGDAAGDETEEARVELDAVLTWSAKEELAGKDFEQMSAAELAEARRAIRGLELPLDMLPTRRFRQDPHGRRIDMRGTLRRSMRGGSHGLELIRRERLERPPPLVILCDVSGSMSRYARMLLLFMHTLASDRDRVSSFLFGTRLTHVTRQLAGRDIDEALAKVGQAVQDWSGGTRIGHCLARFNRDWSRRVLGQGAVLLLITDGLDRDAGEGLEREMERLHKSCRRLIWLNPLLRWGGYEPLASGARAMLPHVDELRPVHNLDSLRALAAALSGTAPRRLEARARWAGLTAA